MIAPSSSPAAPASSARISSGTSSRRTTSTRVVNLDKLTYAGNPATLADLERHPRYTFVHGDIADAELLAEPLRRARVDAVVHFAAESHVDRSIDSPEAVPPYQRRWARSGCSRPRAVTGKRSPPSSAAAFRFLHVSTDEVYGTLRPGRSRPSPRKRPSRRTAPTPRARRAATTSRAPISTPTGCRWSRRTARTTTARSSSRKSSSR